jgi:hypothetical protein
LGAAARADNGPSATAPATDAAIVIAAGHRLTGASIIQRTVGLASDIAY